MLKQIRNSKDIQSIYQFLQKNTRSDSPHISIESEYPIVLKENIETSSFYIELDQKIACHGSFWIREIIDPSDGNRISIALIGNIATDAHLRKKGYMKNLLQYLTQRSKNLHLSALILWSDQVSLYQKNGFMEKGKEIRYLFDYENLKTKAPNNCSLQYIQADQLSKDDLKKCLSLRPKTSFTLARSTTDFKSLLSIYNLKIFIDRNMDSQEIKSYYLVEKGVDMKQVIHEWGTDQPNIIGEHILAIMEYLNYSSLMVLSPIQMDKPLRNKLSNLCVTKETHTMALIKTLSNSKKMDNLYKSFFIWGLDSI